MCYRRLIGELNDANIVILSRLCMAWFYFYFYLEDFRGLPGVLKFLFFFCGYRFNMISNPHTYDLSEVGFVFCFSVFNSILY